MTAADKLAEAAITLRDDLLMRAKMNAWQHDGEVVVDCGNGVWRRINDCIAAYEREKAGQDVHSPSIEAGGYRIPVRLEKP